MTDFRSLCARMADELDYYRQLLMDDRRETHALAVEARAALSEPRPAADGEVAATGKSGLQDGPAVQSREPASVITEPSDEELRRLYCELFMLRCDPLSLGTGPVRFARAVLARWGTTNLAQTRSSLEPIPVSERLPEAGDCDAEGRCWWWYAPVPEQTYGYWAHEDHAIPERALGEWPTHWLPAHALPLPKEVE